ncbi:MAG: helix-turn-helix transcriptional regulator [Sphingomonas sp.]|nr:helix-turn-helix transcriptional regulator [Sphingomonas sp.]MDX3884062.1 helix-turn-helix transcriptional regulator [Sphingomonas sp.]
MDLKTYLETRNVRQAEFAELAGTTPATISRLVSGGLRPALDLAHRIERASGGEVPTEVWLRTPPPPFVKQPRRHRRTAPGMATA